MSLQVLPRPVPASILSYLNATGANFQSLSQEEQLKWKLTVESHCSLLQSVVDSVEQDARVLVKRLIELEVWTLDEVSQDEYFEAHAFLGKVRRDIHNNCALRSTAITAIISNWGLAAHQLIHDPEKGEPVPTQDLISLAGMEADRCRSNHCLTAFVALSRRVTLQMAGQIFQLVAMDTFSIRKDIGVAVTVLNTMNATVTKLQGVFAAAMPIHLADGTNFNYPRTGTSRNHTYTAQYRDLFAAHFAAQLAGDIESARANFTKFNFDGDQWKISQIVGAPLTTTDYQIRKQLDPYKKRKLPAPSNELDRDEQVAKLLRKAVMLAITPGYQSAGLVQQLMDTIAEAREDFQQS